MTRSSDRSRCTRPSSGKGEAQYAPQALRIDRTDGLSFEYAQWRFNLRSSNTEPLIRLNVEARDSQSLMQTKTAEVLALLGQLGAVSADH